MGFVPCDKTRFLCSMPLVAFSSLGCSKNQVDGSKILDAVVRAGYSLTQDPAQAELVIVNTCAFIEAAQVEAIDAILEMAALKKNGKCAKLIVTGCFSQRFRESAARKIPEVDVWAGTEDWPELLARFLHTDPLPSYTRVLAEPIASQYLKIAEGCSHGCAFCAIPLIRGAFVSRPLADIVTEAQWLAAQGVRECILVAQDSSFYGRDIGTTLSHLLEALLQNTPFPWIRVMYLHPAYIDDGLLNLFARQRRLCPYFDIPLQHASDIVLKAMGRRPLSKEIIHLINRIREMVPDAAIRTSFITGFPGETEKHFEELLHFVETMKFDKVGVFQFSPEQGTPAFSLHPRPRSATALRRSEALMSLQREISAGVNASRVGGSIEVLIEAEADIPGYTVMGRSRWDAPEVDGNVYLKGERIASGVILRATVTGAGDYDLFAEAVK